MVAYPEKKNDAVSGFRLANEKSHVPDTFQLGGIWPFSAF